VPALLARGFENSQQIDVRMGSASDSIRDHEYARLMEDADRDVLEFIGDQGKTAEQVADRFPAFDLELESK
jgi:hypothetical protein